MYRVVVTWEDGTKEQIADLQATYEHAVSAARSWFRINEMEPVPFSIEESSKSSADRYAELQNLDRELTSEELAELVALNDDSEYGSASLLFSDGSVYCQLTRTAIF